MDISTITSENPLAALPLLQQALTTITQLDAEHLLSAHHTGRQLRPLKVTNAKAKAAHRHATNLHAHVWPEICLPLTGQSAMETANGIYAFESPFAAVFPAGMVHCERRISRSSSHGVLWLSFGKAYVISMISIYQPDGVWHTPLRWQIAGRLASQMVATLPVFSSSENDLAALLALEPFRLALLALVADVYRQAMSPPRHQSDEEGSLGHHHVELLKQLAMFIEQHLDQPIRLEQLASIAHLSPNHLNTLFRRWKGQPVHAWIVARRMDKAMALLQRPGMLAKQAALEVGYDDPLYFSRAFHKHFGFWPSQAKEQAVVTPPLPDTNG